MNPRACAAVVAAVVAVIGTSRPVGAQIQPFQGPDLYRLQTVGDVQISPDGQRVAYSVRKSDRPGRPYSEVWVMETASGEVSKLGGEGGVASGPRWSPDGREIAYIGVAEGQAGLVVARADGSSAKFLAPITGTNHPLPSAGERITWSPDGNRIAFVSATKAPVDVDNGDPIVITRYLYKPTASEGMTRFNDNRRVHIFIFDRLANRVHQLTSGRYYEHSIDWSPRGDEIVFISNHEPDPDRTFNYDIHAVRVENGEVRRVTDTASAEYQPKWSPDGRSIAYLGTRRSFTSSETTMEDTHVWVVDADGRNRRELGGSVDNRQRNVRWAADGQSLYFTVQARGNVHLFRLPVSGGSPQMLVIDRGRLGAWSVANDGAIAYAFTPPSGPTELYMRHEGLSRTLTSLNAELLAERAVAEVEAFTFSSFDRRPIEAFLTKPVDLNPVDPMGSRARRSTQRRRYTRATAGRR